MPPRAPADRRRQTQTQEDRLLGQDDPTEAQLEYVLRSMSIQQIADTTCPSCGATAWLGQGAGAGVRPAYEDGEELTHVKACSRRLWLCLQCGQHFCRHCKTVVDPSLARQGIRRGQAWSLFWKLVGIAFVLYLVWGLMNGGGGSEGCNALGCQ